MVVFALSCFLWTGFSAVEVDASFKRALPLLERGGHVLPRDMDGAHELRITAPAFVGRTVTAPGVGAEATA